MKDFKILTFNDKEEWCKARRIGGSDLATIMGEGKWQTINDVYTRLIYPDRAKNNKLDNNKRVQEGTKAEKYIRELWQLEHSNYRVYPAPCENWLFVRNDNEFISVSPDAILNDYTGALEIKDIEVHSNKELEKWKNADIKKQYFYQIMQYFIVINTLQEVYLVARIKVMNGQTLDYVVEYCYHFTRKEFKKTINECLKIESAFIEKYIKTHTRPNVDYLKEFKK